MDVEVKLCDLGQVNPHAVVNVHSPGLPSPGDDGTWLILWGFPGSHGVIFFYSTVIDSAIKAGELCGSGARIPGPISNWGRVRLGSFPWDVIQLPVPTPELAKPPGLQF